MASVSHTRILPCSSEGTRMEDDSNSISAFMAGSSGDTVCSLNSRPASLAMSQPRNAQAP